MRTVGKTLGITAAVVLIAACDPAPPEETTALHTDPGPVAKTFPELGEISEASWVEEKMGGAEGRVSAPGPTDYRLSALVRLAPGAVPKVLSRYECSQVGQLPETPERLRALIPAKVSWFSCRMPTNGKDRTAYVFPGSDQAVLTSMTM